MVDVARAFCILCLWALWVLSTVYKPEQRLYLYEEKQRQRHFGGKNALLTHRGHPCLSLSAMSTYPSRIEEGRIALVYGMGCTSQERKNPFSPLYSRKNGWKKICLSIQNHGFKSIFIALLEMALSCWYFGALKGQESRGW